MHTETLATAMFEGINFKGEFLKQKITRQLFTKEQYIPSMVLDRGSIRGWQEEGRLDTFSRAKLRVQALLREYQLPKVPSEQTAELQMMVEHLTQSAGMDRLPEFE